MKILSTLVAGFGAGLTGIATLGEAGMQHISENPEVLAAAGAAAGVPWAGPAILAVAAIWKIANSGQGKGSSDDDE